jgi:hypothetical protein
VWEHDLSLWILPTFLMWKVEMIFQKLWDQTRAQLQFKFELLDVDHQKLNKINEI